MDFKPLMVAPKPSFTFSETPVSSSLLEVALAADYAPSTTWDPTYLAPTTVAPKPALTFSETPVSSSLLDVALAAD